jgi:hypothetical protein
MTKMIQLSMYIDQHGKGGGKHQEVASGSFKLPFSAWALGHVVIADQRRSNNDEEWTIKAIGSSDGKMHREDCTITLVNKAAETREVKGSTLQSGYEFKSIGDAVPPPELEQARTDVKPLGVDLEGIREFYPRNSGEGTRLLMHDKTIYIVLESFSFIWRAMQEAGLTVGVYKSRLKNKEVEGAATAPNLEGN